MCHHVTRADRERLGEIERAFEAEPGDEEPDEETTPEDAPEEEPIADVVPTPSD